MIPFYVYYSMFGFQRIGDLAWAAGDCRARGFLMGGTAGRTTLNGEGLQHEDGHSHLLSATIPNCVSYDPTYAHEVAVIIQDGLRRMFTEQEDVFYYLTLMNENYQPPRPARGPARRGDRGHQAGHVPAALHRRAQRRGAARACSCWAAARSCARSRPPRSCSPPSWGVAADIWSCPSFTELARDGAGRGPLEPAAPRRAAAHQLGRRAARRAARPVRSSPRRTTCGRSPSRSAPSVPADRRYVVLGTDGFGRSDYRKAPARALRGRPPPRRRSPRCPRSPRRAPSRRARSTEAIARYGIDTDKPNPAHA